MNKLSAALLAALMTITCFAQAASGASKSERVLHERPPGGHPAGQGFALKGRVEEPQADGTVVPYAQRKVLLQKRTCRACAWKPVKQLRTNDRGVYLTRILVPLRGRWYWRVRVKGSDGYAATTGVAWATGF